MKVVVMIPAYNEELTIKDVIRSIPRDFADVKILVIDDGSKDGTVKMAKEAKADKIIIHGTNKGLGITFRDGIETALKMGADVIVNIDADGQFDCNDIPRLVQPIVDGKADMVTCSRFLNKQYAPRMPFVKRFGNEIITMLINFITGRIFSDTQCGFRSYSREAALRLNLFGEFTYTQEVFLDLLNKGFRIKEIPCIVKGQRKGKSRLYKNWFNYGIRVLLIMLRSIRDYRPLMFFGGIGIATFLMGFIVNVILLLRWVATKQITPFRTLAILGLVLILLGFLFMVLALLADMYARQRKIQEEILYRLKKNE